MLFGPGALWEESNPARVLPLCATAPDHQRRRVLHRLKLSNVAGDEPLTGEG